jgi:hypothetical protein
MTAHGHDSNTVARHMTGTWPVDFFFCSSVTLLLFFCYFAEHTVYA